MNDETDTSVEKTDDENKQPAPAKDPVRKWTRVILILAFVLMIWYLAADRITPYTTQARLHAQVVPIAAEVSGPVIEVAVSNNQVVAAGDTLFSVDPGNYEIALENARESRDRAPGYRCI